MMNWFKSLFKRRPPYVKGSNPGACMRYPDCEMMCTSCDIELFNAYDAAQEAANGLL